MADSMNGNLLPVTSSKRRLATCPVRVKTKLPTYDQRLGIATNCFPRYITLRISDRNPYLCNHLVAN
ncbi:hypothetical protein BDK62_104127 [Halomonas alkaliantarctica]|nr:hypothetical protein BDK62_104127 [Halomonas alkaliantarctica]